MATEDTNLAAWQMEKMAPFTIKEAELWEPGENEVRIKVRAAAIQPAEGKIAHQAILPLTYPAILGSTCAGTVDALGANVTKVSVGDRVSGGLANYARRGDPAHASLQRYTLADVSEVVDIGPDLAFANAVAANSMTPAASLFKFLGMQYPGKGDDAEHRGGQKLLIWGGSSAMGVLSVRYAKLAGYTVVTTASKHNHAMLKEAGADVVLDRNDPQILESLKAELPVDFWFDTIALPDTVELLYKLAEAQRRSTGKDVHIVTLLPATSPGYPASPEGVTTQMMLFRGGLEENKSHVAWLMGKGGFLETGMKNGSIRGVPAEVVGGLDAVQKATETIVKGVSAKKLIIDPWL
ncbi:uncharacterized protein HMPREF1541_08044 [Cyphellophora europaea CBS 101466]|uniref:Enoyl reductase (ER) domain-containing protein n=1 Tax=Cyphellophora europaea (strain CBS 101466) TaxID=1220924 RepID=W2RMU8_CYPE1|nr:uncharacterized protein HMPREF1541_08044 [Cyphellophora europaea CBS 101466]ETN37054.1 hypothetical protein HMPREF1541_08044 [Cyphellophora europaea CBS 101466]